MTGRGGRLMGALILQHDKPLSAMWYVRDGNTMFKLYRSIEPLERRNREILALGLASQWGIHAPTVRAAGSTDGFSWALMDAISGTPSLLASPTDIEAFVQRTLWLTGILRSRRVVGGPGSGWLPTPGERLSNSGSLLQQMSERCCSQPWWPELSHALTALDVEECVYLHGDIKPEHFLCSGPMVHVVDWEATARGPAACDLVDAAFHLVRDLVYSRTSPLPLDVVGRLPVTGPVIAWRLLRWLDRRRPGDLYLLPAKSLHDLMASPDSADGVRILARLITGLRDAGVPR